MTSDPERLVYYSLFAGPWAAAATRQLVQSVESLRAHNRRVPVRVFAFGDLAGDARAALLRRGVTVEDCGDYAAELARFCPPRVAEALAELPVLHYLLALARIEAEASSQILYLDSDTYFFRDVEELFDRYDELDVYAREEPFSRKSHLGYDPSLVDEEALSALAGQVDARHVPPFNNGILLLNHGASKKLAARIGDILHLVFRFSVGLASRPGADDQPDIVFLRENRDRLVTMGDLAEALPCPTRNVWIKDEIALWLTLGTIPGLRVGLLSRRDALQGDEFDDTKLAAHVLSHYFTRNTRLFEDWLARRGAPKLAWPAAARSADGVFDDLGRKIEAAWERLDFDEHAFPALAVSALREARLEQATSSIEVLRWLLTTPQIPEQDDMSARFGDPPITVYRGRRFFIQVLLWREGSTAIHRHSFNGAFMLLDGASLQVRYEFTPRRRASSRFLLGDLRLKDADLLARGDVVPIEWDTLHAVFHLEAPTATVVVRTYGDDEAEPQYNYVHPSVAYDPFYTEQHATRRAQAVRFLFRTEHPEAMDLVADLVARADLHACWDILWDACDHLGSPADAAPLFEAARRRHGAAIDDLATALHEDLRRRKVGELRREVDDPEQRFFLALLQNLPDRASIEAMVQRRYPDGDPRRRILGWLEALSGVDSIGVDLTDDLNHHLVRALLDGRSDEEVREALSEVFEPEEVAASAAEIERHSARLRATALEPLFR